MADRIPKFEDTLPVDSVSIPKFEDTVPVGKEVPKFEDTVEVKEAPQVSWVEAAISGAGQGLTMGAADEILGFVGAGWDKMTTNEKGSFLDLYRKNQEMFETRAKAAQEQYPVTSIVGEIAGGLLGPGKFVKGIKSMATLGAVEGALRSEADVIGEDRNIGQVAKEAAMWGATGAGLGIVGKGAGAAIKKLTTKAADDGIPKVVDNIVMQESDDFTGKVIARMEEKADDIELFSNAVKKTGKMDFLTGKEAKDFVTFKEAGLSTEELTSFRNMAPEALKSNPKLILEEMKAKGLTGNLDDYVAFKAYYDEMQNFGRWTINNNRARTLEKSLGSSTKLTKSKINKQIAQGNLNPEMYKAYVYEKEAGNLLKSIDSANMSKVLNNNKDPLKGIMTKKFADLRYAVSEIDNVSGLELGSVVDDLYKADNAFSNFKVKFGKLGDNLLAKTEKEGIEWKDIYKYLESPELRAGLSPNKQRVIRQWRSAFDLIRKTANNNGMEIAEKLNYVTHTTKTGKELTDAIKGWAKTVDFKAIDKILEQPIGKEAKKIHREFIKNNKEVRQFMSTLESLSGEPLQSSRQAVKILENIEELRRVKKASDFDIGAAFKRLGEIPTQIRETDMSKIWFMYMDNIGKGVYYKTPIKSLQTHSRILNEMGLSNSAKYIDNYVKHMAGVPSEVAAATQEMGRRIETGLNNILGGAGDRGTLANDIVKRMMQSIYPSYLGFNPRAYLRNVTQPFMMTAGEIGGLRGRELAMQAYADTAKLYLSNPKTWLKKAKDITTRLNLAPQRIRFEGTEALTSALRKGFMGKAVRGMNTIEDTAMYMYAQSHHQNVLVTNYMAKRLSRDVISAAKSIELGKKLGRSEKVAERFIRNMEPGYRRRMKRMLSKNPSLLTIEDELTKYLVAKTQLVYGKVGMAELGRELGSFMTMFTKWPLTVGSEAIYTTKQQGLPGAKKILDKYFAPLVGLAIASSALEVPNTPRQKELLSKKGLTYWSPVTAVQNPSSLLNPPVFDMFTGAMKELFEVGSGNKNIKDIKSDLEKGSQYVLRTFTPLGTVLNTYDRIDPLIYNEEKPK